MSSAGRRVGVQAGELAETSQAYQPSQRLRERVMAQPEAVKGLSVLVIVTIPLDPAMLIAVFPSRAHAPGR